MAFLSGQLVDIDYRMDRFVGDVVRRGKALTYCLNLVQNVPISNGGLNNFFKIKTSTQCAQFQLIKCRNIRVHRDLKFIKGTW